MKQRFMTFNLISPRIFASRITKRRIPIQHVTHKLTSVQLFVWCFYNGVAAVVNTYSTPIDNNSCSFPFTFNGQLYYTCPTIHEQPCTAWCLNVNAVKIDCTKKAYGKLNNSTVGGASVIQWTKLARENIMLSKNYSYVNYAKILETMSTIYFF